MLLKAVLFAYSQGIVSGRGIELACREQVTFIAKLFAQVLYLCDRQGLIGREMFATPPRGLMKPLRSGLSPQTTQAKPLRIPAGR